MRIPFFKRISRYEDVRGERPGFSIRRFWQMFWYDRTRLFEWMLGCYFFVFRGVFLVQLGYSYPGVERFLHAVGLSEGKLGWLCIICGVLHIWGSVTEYHGWRMIFCAFGMGIAVTIMFAFTAAAPQDHPIVVLWASILMFEFTLVLRNYMGWRDGPDAGANIRN